MFDKTTLKSAISYRLLGSLFGFGTTRIAFGNRGNENLQPPVRAKPRTNSSRPNAPRHTFPAHTSSWRMPSPSPRRPM
jgi:hypothetical protein